MKRRGKDLPADKCKKLPLTFACFQVGTHSAQGQVGLGKITRTNVG